MNIERSFFISIDLEVDYKTYLICLYSEEKEQNSQGNGFDGPLGFIRKLVNRKRYQTINTEPNRVTVNH